MHADDVAVIANGQTLQHGPVAEIYRQPASPLVAQLLGIPNALAMTVAGAGKVRTTGGLSLSADTTGLSPGSPVVAVVNPRAIRLGGRGGVPAEVIDVVTFPDRQVVEVRAAGLASLTIHADGDPSVQPGDRVRLAVPAAAVTVSPATPG